MEGVPLNKQISQPQDEIYENHYINSHSRTSKDQYMASFPFKYEPPQGALETHRIALDSLKSMERRFEKDRELEQAY